MHRRTLRLAAGAALAVLVASIGIGRAAEAGTAGKTQAKPRPNVLVVMTDDQTLESVRVMTNTKRLLAAQGTTFDNFFVTFALCCPSRATFLTGQYAHTNKVLGNNPPEGGYEKLNHSNTLPVWLQRGGYRTIHIGKYLNGYGGRTGEQVRPAGWTEWYGGTKLTFFGHRMNENGKIVQYRSAAADYQSDVYTRKAVSVINRVAPARQPFFLNVWYYAPHGGGPREDDDPKGIGTTHPAPRHKNRFAAEPLPQPASFNEQDVSDKPAGVRNRPLLTAQQIAGLREAYQQKLESLLAIDEGIAAMVNALRAKGELDNTLIVFTTDNGFFTGEHRVPSGKVLLYEPSIHVPLIVRGPGFAKNRRLKQMVANIDLAPTIVDAANVKPGLRFDGRSLLPLGKNPKLQWGRDIVIERGPASSGGKKGGKGKKGGRRGDNPSRENVRNVQFSGLRTPRYLYAEYTNGEKELYDLQKDPQQLTSRHNDPAYAAVMSQFAPRLARMRDCAGAACRQGPRVSLALDAATSGTLGVRVEGPDARWVESVAFERAGRAVGTDRAAPFSRVLAARGARSVTALVTMADGRRVTLTRLLAQRS